MRHADDWIWRVALLFVVTVISTAAAASSVSTKHSPAKPKVTVPTTTRPSSVPQVTITTGTLPTAPGSKKTPPTSAGAWPAGTSGYTDVLASISVSAGRAFAETRARAAAAAGLPRVGVLLSSRYPSLRSGYFVVFSGVYPTATQAAAALAEPHARGFADAYEARVTQ